MSVMWGGDVRGSGEVVSKGISAEEISRKRSGFLRDVRAGFKDDTKRIWRERKTPASSPVMTGPNQEWKIGDKMEDGTIYAGISPDTGEAMYTTSADAPLTYSFNQARKHAAKFSAHGHKDWRVPTKGELNVLYNNRAAIGGFSEAGSIPVGWYWSSTAALTGGVWGQRFGNGYYQTNFLKNGPLCLRCVRG